MGKEPGKNRASIVTGTGDAGETSLLYGQRVAKSHPQVEACGAIDELNAALGMAKATAFSGERRSRLEEIQRDLIGLMGEVSTGKDDVNRYLGSQFARIEEGDLTRLEVAVKELEGADRLESRGWALPGQNLHEASLDVARATARRAERRLVALNENGYPLRPLLLRYLNRLSDLLWLLAREAEKGP